MINEFLVGANLLLVATAIGIFLDEVFLTLELHQDRVGYVGSPARHALL